MDALEVREREGELEPVNISWNILPLLSTSETLTLMMQMACKQINTLPPRCTPTCTRIPSKGDLEHSGGAVDLAITAHTSCRIARVSKAAVALKPTPTF